MYNDGVTKPSKNTIRRIISALAGTRRKVVTLYDLSNLIGVYPDVLGDTLAYFYPLIRLDPDYNIRDLGEKFREYLATPLEPNKKKAVVPRKDTVASTELKGYSSTMDYIYKKLTSVSGLIDASIVLTDHDLRLMMKLIERDRRRLKKNKAGK